MINATTGIGIPSAPELRPARSIHVCLDGIVPDQRVETSGLEPPTPCLQVRPTRTATNSDELLRQISAMIRMLADGCERLRMRPECALGKHSGSE
jgi:hypothetical protein